MATFLIAAFIAFMLLLATGAIVATVKTHVAAWGELGLERRALRRERVLTIIDQSVFAPSAKIIYPSCFETIASAPALRCGVRAAA
jgi:hypothetical protein